MNFIFVLFVSLFLCQNELDMLMKVALAVKVCFC